MIPRSTLSRQLPRPVNFTSKRRFLSASTVHNAQAPTPENPSARPHAIDPRWLTMMKRRIGRCMMFGLKPVQINEGGQILQQLARDWRELLAGSEGFLTDEKRRSLFRHNVVWGEQDVMVSLCSLPIAFYAPRLASALNHTNIFLGTLAGHVNNVTYVRYAETARVNWTRNIGIHIDPEHRKEWLNMVNSTGIGLILRSIKIDYKFPMKSPDKITVYQKLVHDPASPLSPQSGFELHVMILSEARQRPAARCHEESVIYDYQKNRKTPQLPPFIFKQFKTIWELQEKSKLEWQQRILDIESRVRTLEVESWDRADAVEDTGSAKQ
ncbi:uncharacterized protein N7484_011209 [Penicillium longicatenatum]|uniref:uncharacterized protein n=1 Tax=Penicillium longicatenatum TaxID=1561947 RepID=UPI0025480EB3|nr:uncharacterized protein N7484_011209 [Penicillium longicatenatum]KAJ5631109.1 hypothetical protein N7484_011209 [Penicillium longicatenatum]